MAVRAAFSGYFEIFFEAPSSTVFAPLSGGILVPPRTDLSSAVSQGYLVLYITEFGP